MVNKGSLALREPIYMDNNCFYYGHKGLIFYNFFLNQVDFLGKQFQKLCLVIMSCSLKKTQKQFEHIIQAGSVFELAQP